MAKPRSPYHMFKRLNRENDTFITGVSYIPRHGFQDECLILLHETWEWYIVTAVTTIEGPTLWVNRCSNPSKGERDGGTVSLKMDPDELKGLVRFLSSGKTLSDYWENSSCYQRV